MNNQYYNEPIPNLTDEQAIALNKRPYCELPQDIHSQVIARLTALQMRYNRDNQK